MTQLETIQDPRLFSSCLQGRMNWNTWGEVFEQAENWRVSRWEQAGIGSNPEICQGLIPPPGA
jgi:hypothetical protein